MKIIVIGGGLLGVTTAYLLNSRGHDVTVIDRGDGPGRETSFANGTLLTPSMSDPWNAPGCWRVLLASLGKSDSAMQLRLRALPALLGWGITFLRNSNVHAYERNVLSNLRLALYSLEVMRSIREQTNIEYGRTTRGTMKVFRDAASFERACESAVKLQAQGLSFRRLSSQQTIELEPALAPIAKKIAGALHFAVDETGDAYRFCVALAEGARSRGVEFRLRTPVSTLETRSDQVTAVLAGGERFVADQYIVAAGSYSTPLLRHAGIRLPVRPAKGYSVTFKRPPSEQLLKIPVIDDHLHAVVVSMEGAIRVAGTAEFAGYDLSLPAARIRNLLSLLKEVLPQAPIDPATAQPWCGLRAMSADGVPIIGPTRVANLLVNTGHGHLGWTMAAGSAQLLADLTCGESPAVDPAPFALARFTAAG
jgi:D-amino-acid dehydrogenase